LACAALLPDRCLAAASIAGVAPRDVEDLDWLAGMGPENIEECTLAVRGEPALTPFLEAQAVGMRTVNGTDLVAALGGLLPAIDKQVLTGEVADMISAECRRAFESGIAGWRDDDLAFSRDWGIDLGAIRVPVSVWQGGQDLMVPFAHGEWLAAHIAGASAHLFADHGHISLAIAHVPAVFADLAERAITGGT
jgi:pimeloyl-ACP methyl ester carboxylesterase